jgi:hypothetical protein
MPTIKTPKKVVKKVATKKTPVKKAPRRKPSRSVVHDLMEAMEAVATANEDQDRRVREKLTRAEKRENEKNRKLRFESGNYIVDDITDVFNCGDKIIVNYMGESVGGELVSININYGFFGPTIQISYRCISIGERGTIELAVNSQTFRGWEGTRTMNELPFRKLEAGAELDKLVARGRVFREVTSKASYMNYQGEIFRPSWIGWFPMSGNGRVMVDGLGMRNDEPNILDALSMRSWEHRHNNDDTQQSELVIPDDQLYMTSPFIPVFSFRHKRWAIGKVDFVSPVVFNTGVFDQLVLDEDRKFIIKSLVEHNGSGFSDIVGGKSGGFIFLLHGAPGVGKTLTAEATSETLQRPLYVVSVGELGTNPQQLETKLGQILELAGRWNAVLLLDEADIFLEQRTDHDLERNAMVGIFLRLLEYFNGVMFLTTNRVKNFDRAFHSRISLAIHYGEMTDEIRRSIRKNLLSAAKIDYSTFDLDVLSKIEINGRQIKNSIRLAQTIAHAEGTKVTQHHLLKMSKYGQEFVNALGEAENYA